MALPIMSATRRACQLALDCFCWFGRRIRGLIGAPNFAAAITGAATVVLALLAFFQWRTSEAILAANRIGQRAWMALDIKLIDGEDFKYGLESGGKIKVNVTLRNVGNEPAAIAWTEIALVPDKIGRTQDFSYVREQCERMRMLPVDGRNSYGIYFPKDSQTYPYTASISSENLKAGLALGSSVSFVPLIVGCVTYAFLDGKNETHQTGFVYYLKRRDDRFFYVTEGSTPASSLKLQPWIAGGFFAN